MELKELASGLVLGSHIGWKFKGIVVRVVKNLLQNAKTLGNIYVPRGVICGGSTTPHEIRKDLQNRAKRKAIVKTVKNCWI